MFYNLLQTYSNGVCLCVRVRVSKFCRQVSVCEVLIVYCNIVIMTRYIIPSELLRALEIFHFLNVSHTTNNTVIIYLLEII
jgi:hypothetical protein